MMQTIGAMIAFYIITRMAELIDRSDRSLALKILASVTMIVAVIGIFSLFGGTAPAVR